MQFAPIAVLVATASVAAVQAPANPPVETPTPLQTACKALFDEFSEACRKWRVATQEAKTEEESRAFQRPDGAPYAARFMEMAIKRPDDPAAVEALVNAILVDPFGRSYPEAVARLRSVHTRSPGIGRVLQVVAFDMMLPAAEPLLRAVLEANPDAATRGDAALALAEHLRRKAGEVNHLASDPEAYRRVASRLGEDVARGFRDRDSGAMIQEVESLLELVVDEYADFPFNGHQTLGERARAVLGEMRELVVGKPAPEIEGEDVDGEPMRLSDHRGKVVVLVWWATWCGVCMDMIPHERELVRRMEGAPFVLLGVNGDEGRERLEHQIKERGIAWRSWYDGGPDGPISRRWNVGGWPTVYVLDRDGVIRYKGSRDVKKLDEAIDALLPGR
jgi:peroxiredoxin